LWLGEWSGFTEISRILGLAERGASAYLARLLSTPPSHDFSNDVIIVTAMHEFTDQLAF